MLKRLHNKTILKFIGFIIGFLIIYNAIFPVFGSASVMHNGIPYEYYGFDKNTFDVVFVGSSIIGWDVHPLQLYDEEGISAYNLYSAGQRIPQSYYVVKQALREQHPELVVLEVAEIGRDGLVNSEGLSHWMIDSLSFPERTEYIMDLVPKESRWNYWFPFNVYHSRWDSLSEEDFSVPLERRGTYGSWIWYGAYPFDSFGPTISDKAPLPKSNEEYLRKTIELCQKENVNILLTLMPLNYNLTYTDTEQVNRTEYQKYWNEIQDIADEYGINYLNFMYHYKELGLDPADSMDGTHMNADSAEKMTRYIGQYIKENYEIPDVREDSAYDFMREDFEEFQRLKAELKLKSITDFSAYLDMLAEYKSSRYTILISVKDIQGYSLTQEMTDKLAALGCDGGGRLLEKQYHSFISVINGSAVIEIYGDDEAISYAGEINGRELYISSKTLNMGNQAEIKIGYHDYSKNTRGFNIVLYDNQKEEIIDSVGFDTHVPEFTCNR